VSDFNFVTERIAVGAQISCKADVDQLVAAGITHVCDMRAEYDDTLLADPRIVVLWLPEQDDGSPRPRDHVLNAVLFGMTGLSQKKNRVLYHCAAGVNRGPTACYALLRAFGIARDAAIQMIRSARPQVGFFTVPNYVNSVEEALFD
jgi:protein-tyrosine phosphatase